MIGGVTSHMLPHLSAVFHLYENRPLVRNFTRFQSLMPEKVNTFLTHSWKNDEQSATLPNKKHTTFKIINNNNNNNISKNIHNLIETYVLNPLPSHCLNVTFYSLLEYSSTN